MTGCQIKQAIAANGRVYGTLVSSWSPLLPPTMKTFGIDFVFVDTEHIPLGPESLGSICTAFAAAGIAPIVRIASPDPYAATQAVDFGAHGVVAPYVEEPKEVEELRGAVKYRPLKGDRLQGFLFRDEPLDGELSGYLARYNRDVLLLVNIESVPAYNNLDALLNTPDLDGILIGPHDLSCSLNIPERYEEALFSKTLADIISETRKRHLIAGIHFSMCGDLELAARWLEMGINLYVHQADLIFATAGLAGELQQIQRRVGEDVRFSVGRISI
jgi:4-hydroxy-2-oxoheptanedioate aldolase